MFNALYLPEERGFIRYLDIPGADPPLLWLHGLMCSSTGELMPAAAQPELRGRRQLLVDLLGYGYSDRPVTFGYTLSDHARTIATLIDDLALTTCAIIGHSMGGGVAIRVAAARPQIVSLLILAEGNIGPDGDPLPFVGQTEQAFVERGFSDLLASQTREAEAQPSGLRAAHLGITRVVAPYAIHRAATAEARDTDPPLRSILKDLLMTRWYLVGAESESLNPREDLEAAGVEFKVVPDTGHAMGLQNPHGLAQAVAEIVAKSWIG